MSGKLSVDMSRFAPRTDWARSPRDRKPRPDSLGIESWYQNAYAIHSPYLVYGGSGGGGTGGASTGSVGGGTGGCGGGGAVRIVDYK